MQESDDFNKKYNRAKKNLSRTGSMEDKKLDDLTAKAKKRREFHKNIN